MNKNYITISGGLGRSKLYILSKNIKKKLLKEFPDFENMNTISDRWTSALEWIEKNATFVSDVECYCY